MGAYLSKKKKFFVVLCGDVLWQVLQFGNRSQLVKIERVGRRFHWIVENHFGNRPFLRLDLALNQWGELEAFLIGNERVCQLDQFDFANLTLPRFLRLNDVKLFYNRGQMSIEEKCRSIENYSQPLKEALKDSNLIHFYGDIARNDLKKFDDHSKFLNYLSETFLKIFNSSRKYDFSIEFPPEEAGAGANVLNSIIQMPQICRCSNLRFWLLKAPQPLLLPVEAISSWLNRSIGEGMNFIGRTQHEIFLQIQVNSIQNVVEMCEHLAKTFKEAEAPTMPYTFQLLCFNESFTTGEQKFQNTKTNEELSIHAEAEGIHEIEIKRVAKKKN